VKSLLFPATLGVVPDAPAADVDRGDDFKPTGPDADADEVDDKKAADPAKDEDGDDDDEVDAAKRAEAAAKKLEAEDEEEEDEEKKEEPRKKIRIPKERLDQEIAKRRAAEARAAERIQELERQIAAGRQSADVEAIEKKIKELDDKYDDLIADGEKDKAKAVKAEMRLYERQLSRAEATAAALQSKTEALAEYRYDMALSQIEMEYPELNPDLEEDFDKDKAEEVADLIEALKRRGNSPEIALKRAVKYVLGPPKRAEKAAAEADRDIEKDGLRRAQEDRDLEARRKAADVAKKQPANLGKHGKDSDSMGGGIPNAGQIARMTQDQFAKLDEETKAKLRGDEV
jgi:hypothetical protein